MHPWQFVRIQEKINFKSHTSDFKKRLAYDRVAQRVLKMDRRRHFFGTNIFFVSPLFMVELKHFNCGIDTYSVQSQGLFFLQEKKSYPTLSFRSASLFI